MKLKHRGHGPKSRLSPHLAPFQLLTSDEVCQILKIDPNTLSDFATRKHGERIPRFRLGRRYRYKLDQILYWLENHAQ